MKKWIPLSILVVVLLGLVTLGIIKKTSNSEIENLPALMDAKGKIVITTGDFKLEKQPRLGDPNAPVKVIEFLDYKCPACKEWEITNFPKFKKDFIDTGLVQFYVINFPFLGPDSIEAASASEAIFKQNPDKFWEFKHLLYENQGTEQRIWATEKYITKVVKDNMTGIDMELFKKDLKEHTYLLDVKEDFKISAGNGIYQTPSFIVNGQQVGSNYEDLSNSINQMLQSK